MIHYDDRDLEIGQKRKYFFRGVFGQIYAGNQRGRHNLPCQRIRLG